MRRAFILILTLAGALATATAEAQTPPTPIVRREVLRVQQGITSSQLSVFLPMNAAAARPAILLIHGFGAPASVYVESAEAIAAEGYAVAVFDQINIFDPDLRRWIPAGSQALDALVAANADPSSPIFGEIDTARIAAVGHSYGSITALGMSSVDPRVKAVVMWAPGATRGNSIPVETARAATVPTLVLASQFDQIAPASLVADPVWQNLSQQRRLFLEIKDAGHNNYLDFTLDRFVYEPGRFRFRRLINSRVQRSIALRYTTAWLNTFLLGQADPAGLTDGRFARSDAQISRVLTP